ncbi:MAG: 30S ribosomal protein S3 [Nanoarchaeota archaeon]|nr:30S ribosomal protein S3 [Nanoarchaeota archaeon]
MIERKFIAEKLKEYKVEAFVRNKMKGSGLSEIKVQKTPLGEKIIIASSRPGLVVGRKGENIKSLTSSLKEEFEFENPQIEIAEVPAPELDPNIIADKISDFLERFGTSKFKGIGHRVMTEVMDAGAAGIEIVVSGKIPSSRARSWRFYQGYLKKCGDTALTQVNVAYGIARLKTGVVGIKVSIMPTKLGLADDINLEKIDKSPEEEAAKKEETPKEDKPKKTAEKEEKATKDEDKTKTAKEEPEAVAQGVKEEKKE